MAEADEQQPAAPLQKLPAELRNNIYGLVLVEKNPIQTHRNRLYEPGLLAVNR